MASREGPSCWQAVDCFTNCYLGGGQQADVEVVRVVLLATVRKGEIRGVFSGCSVKKMLGNDNPKAPARLSSLSSILPEPPKSPSTLAGLLFYRRSGSVHDLETRF